MKKLTALLAIVFCVFLIAPPEVTPMVSPYYGGDPCEGDVDGDGQVGILDLLAVLVSWGECPDNQALQLRAARRVSGREPLAAPPSAAR